LTAFAAAAAAAAAANFALVKGFRHSMSWKYLIVIATMA
jgi:hypothetical protein